MMKKLLTVLFCVALTLPTFAQLPMAGGKKLLTKIFNNVNELKNKPLKVVLLKDKGYKAVINENTRKAVESEFNYHKDISYITPKEYKEYKKNKVTKYAYLVIGKIRGKKIKSTREAWVKTAEGKSIPNPVPNYKKFETIQGLKYLALTNKGKEKLCMTKAYNLYDDDELSEYFLALQSLQFDLTFWNKLKIGSDGYIRGKIIRKLMTEEWLKINKDAPETLKSMTLLIDKDLIRKKLIPVFGEFYKYPYKIVEEEIINKAITTNEKAIAIVHIKEDNLGDNDLITLINSDTGEELIAPVLFGDTVRLGLNFNQKLNKKTIKRLMKNIN